MKHLLLAAALLLGICPANAQTGPSPGPLAAPAAHADSLAVLHRVFRRDRRYGRLGTFLLANATATGVANAVNRPSDQGKFTTGAQCFSFTAYAGFMVAYIVQWARFSQHREALVVRQFEEGQPLPPHVQQRFKRIFVREMARQRRF